MVTQLQQTHFKGERYGSTCRVSYNVRFISSVKKILKGDWHETC